MMKKCKSLLSILSVIALMLCSGCQGNGSEGGVSSSSSTTSGTETNATDTTASTTTATEKATDNTDVSTTVNDGTMTDAKTTTFATSHSSSNTTQKPSRTQSSATTGTKPSGHVCTFDKKVVEAQYLKVEATCTVRPEYYYSCACGKKGDKTFFKGNLKEHKYDLEIAEHPFLVSYATNKTPAVFYRSCICGAKNTETFTAKEETLYKPTSLTVTLYNSQKSEYGFTFNTINQPKEPVIQIKKQGTDTWEEHKAYYDEASSFNKDGTKLTYYISKTEITLKANTTYVYRAYDKQANVGTKETTLKTKDPKKGTFTFVHVGDTQDGPTYFNRVLSSVVDKTDFLIHTGDAVESSKHEHEWTDMLEGNFEYLSRIPIMPVSGNHETTYKNGSNETFKHFNNKTPVQNSTTLGYFYSFTYGNTKFIMLNTNDLTENKLKDEQYKWLVNELKANTCKWTVVALHNPLYSVGKYGALAASNTISLALREQLQGIFAQYGVDVVLQGHDHVVSRTFPIDENGAPQTEKKETVNGVEYAVDPDGVIYVMSGTAGVQTRSPSVIDKINYAYTSGSQTSTWSEFAFKGNTLTVTIKYHDGVNEVIQHTWGIKKSS